MNVHLQRGLSPASLVLAVGLLVAGRAEAYSPSISYVQQTTAYNAGPWKVARAVFPGGYSVLGGGAVITGGQGQVAIQAAFPTHDDSLWRDVYIVKAAAKEDSTDSWSLTAGAYCTPSTVTTKVQVSSIFDSTAIKKVTVQCPYPFKVVGMGGEVSKRDYEYPTNDPETTPNPGDRKGTGLVFQGFDVNAGLTSVTAYAVEEAAALDPDYDYTGEWKLVAFVSCGFEAYFGGLERRSMRATGGDAYDPELTVNIACSPGKRLMAIGDRVEDHDMGQWFIHRFLRLNAVQGNGDWQDESQPVGEQLGHADHIDHLRGQVSRAIIPVRSLVALDDAATTPLLRPPSSSRSR